MVSVNRWGTEGCQSSMFLPLLPFGQVLKETLLSTAQRIIHECFLKGKDPCL